jgi:hypothetical protein
VVHHAFHGTASRRGKNFVRLQCAKNRLRTVLKNASTPYLARTAPRLLWELVWSLAHAGPAAFSDYWAAASDGLSQRGAVAKIARQDRRAIELRWCHERVGADEKKQLGSASNGA